MAQTTPPDPVQTADGGVAGDPSATGEPEHHQGPLARFHARMHRHPVTSLITKAVVTVLGGIVFCGGLVMMVTPGPGIVGIILGLAILATEWTWAERAVKYARHKAHEAAETAREMDPRVRRRRVLLTAGAVVLVVGALTAYVWVYDWPGFALSGWDRMQSVAGFLPDLPGS